MGKPFLRWENYFWDGRTIFEIGKPFLRWENHFWDGKTIFEMGKPFFEMGKPFLRWENNFLRWENHFLIIPSSPSAKRASSSIMECEEFILPDWSPPDNPIQSERAKHASSSIMECEEFITGHHPTIQLGRLWPSYDNDDDDSPCSWR